MSVEFPKIEYIISNDLDKLTKEQRGWLKLMTLRESVLNLAIKDFVGLSKNNGLDIYVSVFLDSVYSSIRNYLFGECEKQLLFDDFVYIASIASKALKTIIDNPSTKLIKVEELVKYNKLTSSSTKTMQWLAKRPGTTVREKIAPSNRILTVLTKFSVDTKENEASMYLYDVLYGMLENRLFDSQCKDCTQLKCKKKIWFDELMSLYSLKTRIRQSELSTIPKVRHNVQNNKLMCDIYYKTVWDCNLKISRIEKEFEEKWNNLENNLYKDMFFYVVSVIRRLPGVKIKDQIGKIEVSEKGELSFTNVEEFVFFRVSDRTEEYRLSFSDNMLHLKVKLFEESGSAFKKTGQRELEIDFSKIIDDLTYYIQNPETVGTDAIVSNETEVSDLNKIEEVSKEQNISVAADTDSTSVEENQKQQVEQNKKIAKLMEEPSAHTYPSEKKLSKIKSLSQKCVKFYKDLNIETVQDFLDKDKEEIKAGSSFRKSYLDELVKLLKEDGYEL